jgi:hypothetical protein
MEKYIVELTSEEQNELAQLVSQSTAFDGDSSSMDYGRLWNVRSRVVLLVNALSMVMLRLI